MKAFMEDIPIQVLGKVPVLSLHPYKPVLPNVKGNFLLHTSTKYLLNLVVWLGCILFM
jgi:hypothetical protein